MATTHTPGPWRMVHYTGHEPKGDWPGEIKAENGQEIYAGPFSFRALCGATPKEAEANARLIAAAPELLAACLSVIDMLGDKWPSYITGELAMKAIRKATAPA